MALDRSGEKPHDLGALNQTLIVKTDVVGIEKVVTLAGLHHVIRAGQAILDRLAGHLCQQGGHATERCCLGFLATKAATYAADFSLHRMNRQAQYLGNQFLYF